MAALGHIDDANTHALYRFLETDTDPRVLGPLDSTATRWTLLADGNPMAAYDRIAGKFARRVSSTGGALRRTTAAAGADLTRCYGSWTCEAFVRLQSIAATNTILTHSGLSTEGTGENVIMSCRVEATTGRLGTFWEYAAAANQAAIATTTTLVIDTWYHLAWVKDSGAKTVSFYIDGVIQGAAVAYANEATLGANGHWIIGDTFLTGGTASAMWVRDVTFATTIRDATWLLANAARKDTHGTMITDGSTYFTVPCSEVGASDSSGNEYHLNSEGTADTNILIPSEESFLGAADGSSKYLEDATLSTLQYSAATRTMLLADWTIEMWILPSPSRIDAQGLFCVGDPGIDTQAFNYSALEIEADGSITLDVENGAGVNVITTSDPGLVKSGRLNHIAARKTMTGGTWTAAIFVNGVMVEQATGLTNYDGGTDTASTYISLGRGNSAVANRYTGYIGDTRISSIARTDAEILESYHRGIDWVSHIEITGTPDVATTSTSATFTFTITEGDAEYSLDGAGYVAATSPIVLSGLDVDEHTIIIRSADNTSFEQSFTWSVEAITPHVAITSTPDVGTESTDATFTFTIAEGDAEYSLDGAGYVEDTSPLEFTDLDAGEHTLIIRSVDNTTISQTFTWTVEEAVVVDGTGPVITIVSLPELNTDPVVVSVYDAASEFSLYQLTCKDRSDSPKQVVYHPTDGFEHPFGGRSTISGAGTFADPYIFTIYRRGRWPTGVELDFKAIAVDAAGNSTTTAIPFELEEG